MSTAPNDEPEITPGMIEAGVIPLLRFRYDRDDEEAVVTEIYRLMRQLEPRVPPPRG